MAVVLPSWYQEMFVNAENLMIDLFTKVLPGVESGCWCPDDWLEQQVIPDPMIWFFRMPGGHVDWQARRDECFMQTMVVTNSRDDSWRVMDVVRGVLLPWQGEKFMMADGYTAQIHSADEVAGPQLLTPGQQIDTRVVTATFKVSVGMKTAKNFKQYIAAL